MERQETRALLAEAEAALAQAQAAVGELRRVIAEAEEDATDLALAEQRLQEVRDDPSLIITGEALAKRLAALR